MNIAIGIDPGIDTGGLAMIPENGEVKVGYRLRGI